MDDRKSRNAIYAMHKLACYARTEVLTNPDLKRSVRILDCIEWCLQTMVRDADWDQTIRERLSEVARAFPEYAGIVRIYEMGDPSASAS